MLISKNECCFLLVDVQEKLFPFIHQHQQLAENCEWLLKLARELNIPLVVSEQYPQGLGHTLPVFKEYLTPSSILEKVSFSCAGDEACVKHLEKLNKKQVVVFGIEAHVCILQTVLGFISQGYAVFVVADAISSRSEFDREMAIQRMRANGATIVTKEMVFFECIRQAGTEQFKQLSKQFFPRGDK